MYKNSSGISESYTAEKLHPIGSRQIKNILAGLMIFHLNARFKINLSVTGVTNNPRNVIVDVLKIVITIYIYYYITTL